MSHHLLFQISPDDVAMRKRLRTHVLLNLTDGKTWRGTLSEWSFVKKTLTLTNAQIEGPEMTGLGLASKAFSFDIIREVRVADASPEVLATLTPELQDRAKATAASLARSAAEDARTETHRDMTELVHEAKEAGVSFVDMLMQRGLAKVVDDDDDDDQEASSGGKKKRRRGGKKKKKNKGLVAVDPNVSAQLDTAISQAAAAAAQQKPHARVILEFRTLDQPPMAHIMPGRSTRGHGRVHDLLLNGVGPVVVGPAGQGLPTLDGQIQIDGETTTLRALADEVLQAHEDQLHSMIGELGLSTEARDQFAEKISSLVANAPPGASELDPELARVLHGLEDGSMGITFK